MTKALDKHKQWGGKITIQTNCEVNNSEDLSLAYTPGVAEPCLAIKENPLLSYVYTRRHNMVAVISDGSAVLGLGNIGGLAGMPVMEGKCALFKKFGDVDAFPLVLDTQNVDEIINVCKAIAPSFGGINLEDISAPRCFEIEQKLKDILDIPVFHDDQHGTAVVVLAALINALKVAEKSIKQIKVVIVGVGAAGTAIANLLLNSGVKNMLLVDKKGILCRNDNSLSEAHMIMANKTNHQLVQGDLGVAINGADVVIGVSGPNTISSQMIATMAQKAIVFAMSNPNPEIMPDLAKQGGAFLVGTGRSDFPNQINNVLAFPGIFRGALDAGAKQISEGMKLAAAYAIADLVSAEELSKDYILPKAFDSRIGQAVSKAVAHCAKSEGICR